MVISRFAPGINTEGHRGKMHFPAAALPVKYAQSNAEGI